MTKALDILLQMAEEQQIDWKRFGQILGFKVDPDQDKDKADANDLYRSQVLQPFQEIEPFSFNMILDSGIVTRSNIDQINPRIDGLTLESCDTTALVNLKKELQDAKLENLYLDLIRENEVLSYKRIYIHFALGLVHWGDRPDWASPDWTDADIKTLYQTVTNYAEIKNELAVRKMAQAFDQMQETKNPKSGTLQFENSKMKLIFSPKEHLLKVHFFFGPIAQNFIECFGLNEPAIHSDFRRGNKLELTNSKKEPFQIKSMNLDIILNHLLSPDLDLKNYNPIDDSNFYLLIVQTLKLTQS